MRIIREGNPDTLNQIKRFYCDFCGCVFEANKNEYQTKSDVHNDIYYQHECPYCGFMVYVERK